MINIRISALVCLLASGMPIRAYGAACDAFVTKWAWFIGGEVTVKPDGTFTQQSGNAGTWECTDPARGRITMRWRDGGFINSLVVSPDGQNITSTDLSQSYVTARRSGPAPRTPVVRQEDCCQETFGCETKKIEAEFAQKMAKCHFPGNSGCIAEATSSKASQLKAANEKLRLCNRMPGSKGTSSGLQAGAAPPPPPASNDEFHSTGGLAQGCQPCGFDDPPATSDRTIGQTDTPPEPEPPGPFKLGAEKVVIKPPTFRELWEEWAKDYNKQAKDFLTKFGTGVPDDGSDYRYWSQVLVLPDGTMQVNDPGGSFVPTSDNPFAEGIYKRNLTRFKNDLQAQVHPRPFPAGSKLPYWSYQVAYKRSDVNTPFTPAPTPQEPQPARPKPRRTTRR